VSGSNRLADGLLAALTVALSGIGIGLRRASTSKREKRRAASKGGRAS
jgi:hypothetical protein